MFNPLKVWREEKAADRALLLEGINVLKAAFNAQAEQAKAMTAFMDGFKVTETPIIREWDEEASLKKLIESRESRGLAIPDGLDGLSRLEQFEMLLDHMDA